MWVSLDILRICILSKSSNGEEEEEEPTPAKHMTLPDILLLGAFCTLFHLLLISLYDGHFNLFYTLGNWDSESIKNESVQITM